ncbi:acyltransferase family protein, partial [Robertkochia marina]
MAIRRIAYFDYARFLAILGVILVHVGQHSSISLVPKSVTGLGRFGVQLFFIVSGATIYITYNSLLKKTTVPNRIFYIKRFFRIVPLFILMGFYYSLTSETAVFHILSPLSGLNPYYMDAIAGGWSIWNEMYFYLIFPLYFLIRDRKGGVFVLSAILVLLSFIINTRIFGIVENSVHMMNFDYLNIFTQFICFVFGIEMMAKAYKKILIIFTTYLLFGFGLKWLFFNDYIGVTDFGASYWLALISILCLAILYFLKYLSSQFEKIHDHKIFRLISTMGQMTYTSYMIHFVLIDIYFKQLKFDYGLSINFLLISAVTFSLSYFLKPYTEN